VSGVALASGEVGAGSITGIQDKGRDDHSAPPEEGPAVRGETCIGACRAPCCERNAREEDVRFHTALLATSLIACASASASRTERAANRDVLTAAEIESINAGTLHDAIQQLRPHFLFSRGRVSMRSPNTNRPVVIVNNVPQASLEALRSISARDVQFVRFLSAPDAPTRVGTGYISGVIEVVLK
jgi:hypothetical protein